MLAVSKLKKLSFLIYGLGKSGNAVLKFFKKNKINDFEVWDDDQKKFQKIIRLKI